MSTENLANRLSRVVRDDLAGSTDRIILPIKQRPLAAEIVIRR